LARRDGYRLQGLLHWQREYLMSTPQDEVHIDEQDASGGRKENVVRYILLISLVLVIGLLSLVWITGALTTDDVEGEGTVTGKQLEANEREGIDGVVLGDEGVNTTVTGEEPEMDAPVTQPVEGNSEPGENAPAAAQE
jgi:hypothetical protein